MARQRIAELQAAGALRVLDAEFADLLVRSGGADAAFALAAAAVSRAVAAGHVCLPLDAVASFLRSLADGDLPALPSADDLRAALARSPLVGRGDTATPLVLDAAQRLYLARYHAYERRVADGFRACAEANGAAPDPLWVRARLGRYFALDRDEPDAQAIAVALGLRGRLTVITGGPGTGKTTSVLWLLALLIEHAHGYGASAPRIRLAAPTGKAAARLGDSIRARKPTLDAGVAVLTAIPETASTVHRLLGYRPDRLDFRHDARNPLPADIVVVDEASMLDLPLTAKLLDALRPDARLILLGDRDQLASVEAGGVLPALCSTAARDAGYSPPVAAWLEAATALPVAIAPANPPLADGIVELQRSHRFDPGGGIGRLARAVRDGIADDAIAALRSQAVQLAWFSGDAGLLARRVREHWLEPYRALLDAIEPAQALAAAERFRVLTALREGPFGCVALNRLIETGLLRDARIESATRTGTWYHGRLVLVVENDYRHGLFNGDIGVALHVDARLAVWFAAEGGGVRAFAPSTLPAHEPAYAMTVHKSQGSEFDEVAVVLPDRANPILTRELLYTAITRARQRVSLWAEETVLRETVAQRVLRHSGLPDRLAGRGDGC